MWRPFWAQQFTVTTSMTLLAFEIELNVTGVGPTALLSRAEVWSNDLPGALLSNGAFDLSARANPGSALQESFIHRNGGVQVVAGQSYWLVLQAEVSMLYTFVDYDPPDIAAGLKALSVYSFTSALTPSASPSVSVTPSSPALVSPTSSASASVSRTQSVTLSVSLTPSASASVSPTPSPTPSASASVSLTPPATTVSRAPTVSSSRSPTASISVSPIISSSPSATSSITPTPSPSPTVPPTPSTSLFALPVAIAPGSTFTNGAPDVEVVSLRVRGQHHRGPLGRHHHHHHDDHDHNA